MKNSGFTLLELLIATAILVIGLGAVMRLITLSRARSVAAADLVVAQTACRSELARLLAGKEKIAPVEVRSIDGLHGWRLGVTVGQVPVADLAVVRIFAQKYAPSGDGGDLPVGFPYELIRWVPLERAALPEHGTGLPVAGRGEWENAIALPDGPGANVFHGLGDPDD